MSSEDEKPLQPIGSDAKMLSFVQHYMADASRNASAAAIAAGYSARSANKIGYTLDHHSRVAAELARRMAEVDRDARLQSKRILD